MAHKHNRRRVRPRSRHNRGQDFDSSMNANIPFDPLTVSSLSTPTAPRQQRQLPQFLLSSNTNDVTARHWRNRYIVWQNREIAQRREAAKLEDEQLKIFGGEPGDDVGLCYKMLEVFEGMEWINC